METIHQIKAIVEEEQTLGADSVDNAKNSGKKGKPAKKGKKKPPPSREEKCDRLGRLYVRYYGILRQLEHWHDGMVQPQIRQDVKAILELVICRILALRRSLVELLSAPDGENTSKSLPFPGCIETGGILKSMNLSASAMDPVIPRYIREERKECLRETWLPDGDAGGDASAHAHVSADEAKENMSTCTTCTCSEITCTTSREKEREEELSDPQPNGTAADPHLNYTEDEAAATMQSIARGLIDRARTKHHRHQEAVFVGMKLETTQNADELQQSCRHAYQNRKQTQRENREAYCVALDELREEVQKEEGSKIYDRLYEERMRWISEQITGTESVPESLEDFYHRNELSDDGDECEGSSSGGAKKGKDSMTGETSVANFMPKESEDNPNREHQVLTNLLRTVCVFEERWKDKSKNTCNGAIDKAVARDTVVLQEIEQCTKQTVDDVIMLYLQRLRASIDKGGKSGATKKKGTASKKGGGGSGGGNKQKKEKPLPGEKLCNSMTVLEMVQSLGDSQMVEDCSQNRPFHVVSDFVGSTDAFSSSSSSTKVPLGGNAAPPSSSDGWDRKDPSMNQLQLAVAEFCILPNASLAIKEMISDDDNVRAILLYGPEGCGKQSMVKAVANQLGALLIRLSPELVKGNFHDKSEVTRLIHMIFTVACDERHGPVVLHIDDCEQFFQSSTGKQVDKSGPVRFQKDLLFYKNQMVQKKDRFIIIGTTEHPELLENKVVQYKGRCGKPEKQGMFEKFLFFPTPDYVDRLLLWKAFVGEVHVHQRRLDYSLLASNSKGHTAGTIRRCVESTRKASALSETACICSEKNTCTCSEIDLLAHLETAIAIGDEDRMRFINFARLMEQKPNSTAGAGDKKGKKASK